MAAKLWADPVDVTKLRCDFFSGTARKFLRGPRGIGFLYVSDRSLKRGDFPLYIDMRGADWVSRTTFAPAPDARRFENWEFACSLVWEWERRRGMHLRLAWSVGA